MQWNIKAYRIALWKKKQKEKENSTIIYATKKTKVSCFCSLIKHQFSSFFSLFFPFYSRYPTFLPALTVTSSDSTVSRPQHPSSSEILQSIR